MDELIQQYFLCMCEHLTKFETNIINNVARDFSYLKYYFKMKWFENEISMYTFTL